MVIILFFVGCVFRGNMSSMFVVLVGYETNNRKIQSHKYEGNDHDLDWSIKVEVCKSFFY